MATQKDRVLEYMGRTGSITSLEAFRDLGVTRLSAIIFNLRREGHPIETETVEARNRYGEKVRVARYEEADGCELCGDSGLDGRRAAP